MPCLTGQRCRGKKSALEKNVLCGVIYRGFGATHDPGQGNRLMIIRNDKGIGCQRDVVTIEQRKRFT